HMEQVELQLSRTPYPYPRLNIRRRPPTIFDYEFEDVEILDYQHHPHSKPPVAVCGAQAGPCRRVRGFTRNFVRAGRPLPPYRSSSPTPPTASSVLTT